MKIAYTGIELPEGKIKYNDPRMDALVEKDKPKKVVPFYVEFGPEDYAQADIIVVPKDNILDLLILDMEKCETRTERTEDENEKALMKKCLDLLENEIPLCDAEFSEAELEQIRMLSPLSFKPVLVLEDSSTEVNEIIKLAFEKAGVIFFYTSGPTEAHAWQVTKGTDIITCAGKIHSDLERGFIKGDVVTFEEYLLCHSFNDCKKKGVAKVVDKDHIVEDGDVIEIRFNV